MQYKYRWHYSSAIFAVMSLATFFWLLNPHILQIQILRKNEAESIEKLTLLKNTQAQSQKDSSDTNPETKHQHLLPELMSLAAHHGITIDTAMLTGTPLPSNRISKAHFTAHGEHARMAAFLQTLNNQSSLLIITNFSYQSQPINQTQFNADLVILKQNKNNQTTTQQIQPVQFLWCNTNGINKSTTSNNIQNTSFPINDMHMTGYLHQGNKTAAFLALPNAQTILTTTGDVIGSEHAKVINITSDAITLITQDDKQVVLRK